MKASFRIGLVILLMLFAISSFAQTSTSGSIVGRVSDGSSALPGVTVEITSPSLQGTKVAVTDSKGEFRFSLLPPGVYQLRSSLSGFAEVTQRGIEVGLGRTVTLDVAMRSSSLSEQITVTAEAPVVDVTSATTGANVTAETIESLPLARDFYAVAQIAPGTNADASGTTVYGSTGAENQYIIDGLNTTGVELGTEAKVLNFDFIQEVSVKTGGLPAEYGRITGGVIEAITKSGGNDFSGGVFGYAQPDDLRSDNDTFFSRPGTTGSVGEDAEQMDYGFDLGGFIVKDKLWFFGAYNFVDETDLDTRVLPLSVPGQPVIPAGTGFETGIERNIYAGKLTYRITDNHTLSGTVFGDPSTTSGVLFAILGPSTTYLGERETGGTDVVGRYQGIFGGSLLINALYGHHEEQDLTSGPGTSLVLLRDQSVVPEVRSGGYGFYQNQEFERDTVKLDISKFFGNHEVKFGADREDLAAVNANYFSGNGTQVRKLSRTVNGRNVYRHIFYVNDSRPGFDRSNSATWGQSIAFPLFSEPETENTSAYVQDSWKIAPNFTLNAGVRWEAQDIIGRDGSTNISIDDNWSPRLGVIWDVANNGRSKLYANYGRFYESVPMDINIRAFGGEIQADIYNFSPDPNNLTQDPSLNTAGVRARLLGGHVTPVDPDLEGQYIDEAILGFEYELRPNLALGIKGTYRDLGQIIEDMLIVSEGDYFIANPGQGIGRTAYFYDYSPAPAKDPVREYTGIELSARKRFSNNYQFYASYLWSQLEGNYDGVFQVATGQLDPNINSAYDYADFQVNNDGPLSNDREHQLKFNGSYTFGAGMIQGFNVGLSTYYASGRPLTAYGYSNGYRNWEYFLVPRGSLGRGPSEYEADVHFGYPVRFGGVELNLIADIFNALDRQAATNVDQRYNRVSDGACSGIPDQFCNHDGGLITKPGTLTPAYRLANPRATAPNPDFLRKGTAFTAPRTVRLGVRLSF